MGALSVMSLAAAMAICGRPFCAVISLTARVDAEPVAAMRATAFSWSMQPVGGGDRFFRVALVVFDDDLHRPAQDAAGGVDDAPASSPGRCAPARPEPRPGPVAETMAPMTIGSPVGAAPAVVSVPAAPPWSWSSSPPQPASSSADQQQQRRPPAARD